ncbi:DUF1073 domain-containing protein [Paenilisteria newyorkensis]|uniref:DUF1073 domain-containing protein n=1 Tax=Listeria newyorkensis TaxID=1497681 RepID=UPI000669D89C|nr:anti-CBASS Acb1 family protein [Listeria newyorkensis]KMT62666.1 hypothetical protein X559_0949 [Listeria newyorkensis]
MSITDDLQQLRQDAKENRNDFMLGNGKGNPQDNLTRQRPGAAKILTFNDCKNLYASNGIVKNIIDIIPEDMTRAGWTLKTENKEVKKAIESKWRQLKTKDKFKKLFADDRLYGDGYISIGAVSNNVDNGSNLNQAIDMEKLKSVPYLNAFSAQKVSRFYTNEDMFSDDYGEVEQFEVSRRSQIGNHIMSIGGMSATTQELVHRSRILHQQSLRFEDEPDGRSVLEGLYDIITVMDTSLWSVGQILYDYAFKVFKSPKVDGMTRKDKAEIGMLMDFKFRTEALALIGGDEELKKESTSTTGMKDLLDYGWDYLSGVVRMPKSVLRGQEAGTLTGAQYDVMNYYARVSSMQENELRPHLEYLTRLLMCCEKDAGPKIDPDTFEWAIEFNPLWSVDSKTDAEIRKLTAEADKIYIDSGVLDPEEVNETRFGRFGLENTSKFNADSLEEIDEIAKKVLEAYNANRAGNHG